MTIIVNEQDIEFCVDAIKLIKDRNATFAKKDTSVTNDKRISIYKNYDDEVVIKFEELSYVKEENLEHEVDIDNGWNFVKDGKFPAENTECLCIIRPRKENGDTFKNKDFRAVLYYRNSKFYLEENTDSDDDSLLKCADSDFSDLIIAWKEIILPKEKDY